MRLQWPSKRVKAEAQGTRKFRDNPDITGTAGQGPKFRDCPGHFGTVGNYGEGREKWSQYAERLGHFLLANGITDDDRRRAVFLSVIGPKAYQLLSSLVAPEKPGDKAYDHLIELLAAHYDPPPSEIMQRFKFHTRTRVTGESIATFVAGLRALGQTCGFGAALEDMLRDRLVCGVNDDHIQRRLLAVTETKLDFKKALELAAGMEASDKNARELQSRTRAGRSPPRNQSDLNKIDTPSSVCYRCGKPGHKSAQCRFKNTRCHNCGKEGHLARVCRGGKGVGGRVRQGQPQDGVKLVEDPTEHTLNQIVADPRQPICVEVELDSLSLHMELDTGAAVSLISEKTYRKMFPEMPFQESRTVLKTYSGEPLRVIGQRECRVKIAGQSTKLPLIVVAGEGPSLLGRNWLQVIRLDWKKINQVKQCQLSDVLQHYETLFQPGLGILQGYEAKIIVDPEACPRFCKARSVPYAMRTQVEEELERLQEVGIIKPIQFADWAAPIVPVPKSDGKTIRICGNFKMTVNAASKVDRYPIPKIEDLIARLAGGKLFSKLDMSQAYQQIQLQSESRKLVIINTHRGLFQYKRLPFGVASAPGIFQRVMDSLLTGIPGVTVYLDDILVTGKTEEDHLSALEEVLKRLSQAGLKLRRDKCVFAVPSVVYLGHKIDAQGLHPVAEKVEALREAPIPRNVTELRSYLGLLSYYSRFLPNLSAKLAPLYLLLKQDRPWKWSVAQDTAFTKSKELLTSSRLLVHFDSKLDIVLACDASAYGIGAVLSHRMPDGQEKPIGFVSRTLTEAEKNYSQMEKEGLSCVYGIRRFHSYLFGRHFELQTDHKPLLTLFNEQKPISPQASSRIQRWALKLAAYQYKIVYRSTLQHANADAMSRLPIEDTPEEPQTTPELVLMVEKLKDAPITARQIAHWTERDPLLSRVLRYIREGWPNDNSDDELKPYWSRRLELSVQDGCILWGGRVVVTSRGREFILAELHGGHPGMSRMKALARGWFGGRVWMVWLRRWLKLVQNASNPNRYLRRPLCSHGVGQLALGLDSISTSRDRWMAECSLSLLTRIPSGWKSSR